MPFNDEQKAAIASSAKQDLLISAGAGSGKTATLAERVYRLVSDPNIGIKPSELLVLTFTNNSSFDMKKKILKRFGESDPHYAEMLSSHIQSFDSFNAYLVRLYSAELGIAPSFVLLPDSIAKERQATFLEEELRKAYEDPATRAKLVSFMAKNGFKNDQKLVAGIQEILNHLGQMTPKDAETFIKEYDQRFLSHAFVEQTYHDFVEAKKEALRLLLREALIRDSLRDDLVVAKGEDPDVSRVASRLGSSPYFDADLSSVRPSSDPSQDDDPDLLIHFYEGLLNLLSYDDEEFVEEARKFLEDHKDDFYIREYPGARKKEGEARLHAPTFRVLKSSSEILSECRDVGDFATEKGKLAYFCDETQAIFDVAKAVQKRLEEYRNEHNAYGFSDITALALSLFLEPKYEPIAEEIRSRFRYIMVDEYQDTNDFQEILLDGLTKPRKDTGERAYLFCVGDAKQSIYAFRNSNVALFVARRKKLSTIPGGVIAMNKNYRSAKALLHDINYIFSSYMRLNRGGIDYLDKQERLTYDDEANIYPVPLDCFGIHRIVPPSDYLFHPNKNVAQVPFDDVDYESKAILSDIVAKVSSGMLVYDRGAVNKVRPCEYSDFCILVRKKRSVRVYQKLFNACGIPLNNHVSVHLREVGAIILIQSLFDLIGYVIGDHEIDLPHAFASVARSYVYRYDDTKLHEILSCGDEPGDQKALDAIMADPILEEVRLFVDEYQGGSFREMFLTLLEKFHVVERLYALGEVEDNLSKIESLFTLSGALEDLGGDIHEFVRLFHSIDQKRMEIDSESIVDTQGAVDLMTIHASKGLERKIVYMPSSENGLSHGDARKKPPFDFDVKRGLVFPYFDTDGLCRDEDYSSSTQTLSQRERSLNEIDEEEQEHVRLLYVALTRAENSVIIVGRNKKERSAYIMMEDLPCYPFIAKEIRDKADDATVNEYEKAIEMTVASLPLTLIDNELATRLYKELVREPLKRQLRGKALNVLSSAYEHYRDQLLGQKDNKDLVASVYGRVFYPASKVTSFAELLNVVNGEPLALEEEEEDEEEETTPSTSLGTISEERLSKMLARFLEGLEEEKVDLTFPTSSLSQEDAKKQDEIRALHVDGLLYPLASLFDGVTSVAFNSYETDGFHDDVACFDAGTFVMPTPPKVDESSLPSRTVDSSTLSFPCRTKTRASKSVEEDDAPPKELLEKGNRLHRYLELVDFQTKDTSFIPNPSERKTIDHALTCPLFDRAAKSSEVFREYGYYDEVNGTNGFIDLLFIEGDGRYVIVDYKSFHIDDPDYENQLRRYKENVCRLFGVAPNLVEAYLLSIGKGNYRKVELD